MDSNQNLLDNRMGVDEIAAYQLKESARWAKFIGIVGMVLAVIVALFGVLAGALVSRMAMPPTAGPEGAEMFAALKGVMSAVYLIGGAILFLISFQAFRFGTRTGEAVVSGDQQTLNAGLSSLKSYFKIQGIIMAIYLGFIALAIIFTIIGNIAK